MEENKEEIKHQGKLRSLDNLSLGISMVVAVAFGVGIGVLMKSWSGYEWTLWLGVFWGIAAAGLNVKKAYDRAQQEFKELENDPKYQYLKENGYKDKDDD